ncbi:MAG: 30S ribosomal protein S18 [Candidatus Omnitrophica bacterium]|nr:30S ribosomal protein S18 [Candidatus Omnitrophota bacterium]
MSRFEVKKKPLKRDGKRDGKKDGKRDGLKKKIFKKKPCRFCLDKVKDLDYLDYQKFQKLLTERGKIMPSRITGNCARHQRQLARAIRKARVAALLPFVSD